MEAPNAQDGPLIVQLHYETRHERRVLRPETPLRHMPAAFLGPEGQRAYDLAIKNRRAIQDMVSTFLREANYARRKWLAIVDAEFRERHPAEYLKAT